MIRGKHTITDCDHVLLRQVHFVVCKRQIILNKSVLFADNPVRFYIMFYAYNTLKERDVVSNEIIKSFVTVLFKK